MNRKLKTVIAGTAIVIAATSFTVANSTSAEAATQTIYNLKDSSKSFKVYWTSNCTGAYKTVPIGGKVTGGGKYFRSWRQPANTTATEYIGVFKYGYGPTGSSSKCIDDRRGPYAWEKIRITNTGGGSWSW